MYAMCAMTMTSRGLDGFKELNEFKGFKELNEINKARLLRGALKYGTVAGGGHLGLSYAGDKHREFQHNRGLEMIEKGKSRLDPTRLPPSDNSHTIRVIQDPSPTPKETPSQEIPKAPVIKDSPKESSHPPKETPKPPITQPDDSKKDKLNLSKFGVPAGALATGLVAGLGAKALGSYIKRRRLKKKKEK